MCVEERGRERGRERRAPAQLLSELVGVRIGDATSSPAQFGREALAGVLDHEACEADTARCDGPVVNFHAHLQRAEQLKSAIDRSIDIERKRKREPVGGPPRAAREGRAETRVASRPRCAAGATERRVVARGLFTRVRLVSKERKTLSLHHT